MQYKVPQNVQIEDRILPFMTLRQLIIVMVGGGLAYLVYLNLQHQVMEVWLPPVVVIGGLTAAIAFLKIRGIPFLQYVLLALEQYLNETKRVWVQSAGEILVPEVKPRTTAPQVAAKKTDPADIEKLSATLDTHGLNTPPQ